jgi:hypothetical protein
MPRDTDFDVTAIAFDTGWKSLGTFGRFRTATGESPTACRARDQLEPQMLGRVPACYLGAAQRPNLTPARFANARPKGVANIPRRNTH